MGMHQSRSDWDLIEQVDRVVDYDEYLRSPSWREKRDYVLLRAGYRCQVCNGKERLEVHHRTYDRLGHEDPEDLTVLCRGCHEAFHSSGRVMVGRSDHSSEWTKPHRVLSAALMLAAIWAFFNMHRWSTYEEDPFGYLWRWGRFLLFAWGAMALFYSPSDWRLVIWSGFVAVVLVMLPWIFG
jgi:hypothetical protein